MNCSSCKDFTLPEIKQLSKKIGITLNDLVTSSISVSLHRLLKENGDSSSNVQVVIPANVRFEFYPTREDVKLENKFAGIPIKLPLFNSMKEGYKSISKLMKKYTKDNYLGIYASYAMTFYGQMILPRAFSEKIIDTVSPKFLLGITNIPGPIKPMVYESENKQRKHYCVSS